MFALASAMSFLADTLPPDQVDDALCLTEIIHYEANGEGWEGKKAVANVALKRSEPNAHFPDDICSVLDYPNAFSHRRADKSLDDVVLTQPADIESFEETLELVEKAMTGELKDNTRGADHFFNPSVVNPSWAQNPITSINVGNHRFVKLYP